MARWQDREDTSIDDAQGLDAKHLSSRIDDGLRIAGLAHGTSRRGVPDGHGVRAEVVDDLGIGGDVRSREVFLADDDVLDVGPHVPDAFHGSKRDLDVGGVREEVGVDDGGDAGVGAGDGDVPAREGCDESCADGAVVAAHELLEGVRPRSQHSVES